MDVGSIARARHINLPLWLRHVLAAAGVGAAAYHILAYLWIAVSRMGYPFALEWMEGGALVQVNRILAGAPLYVRPSFGFVPMIYPPLYFYVSAAASLVTGGGFLPLRLVSIAASLGSMLLIYRLVREESQGRWAGFIAAGLFCATFSLSDSWFDLARVDSLFLFFLLLSTCLLSRDRVLPCLLGGLSLALAVFTKQTALGFLLVIGLFCVLPPKRSTLTYLGSAILAILAGIVILNRLTEGWFTYYFPELPSRHAAATDVVSILLSVKGVLWGDAVKPLLIAWGMALAYFLILPGVWAIPGSADDPGPGPGQKTQHLVGVVREIAGIVGVTCLASLLYLGLQPSDPESRVLGPFSIARLALLSGMAVVGVAALAVWRSSRRNGVLARRVARALFARAESVPKLLVGVSVCVAAVAVIIGAMAPQWIMGLTPGHVERLLPYAVVILVAACLVAVSWRLIGKGAVSPPWFLASASVGLVLISWVGDTNPGAAGNVLMPACAAVAVLFGMAIGKSRFPEVGPGTADRGVWPSILGPLALLQLLLLIGPLRSNMPSKDDKTAGQELVNWVTSCPGDVYLPFHTYIAELAGKPAHAGWIEMAELWGEFGGASDRLWDEVRAQMDEALRQSRFSAIVQDNVVFGDALSPEYEESTRVFEDPDVFWPVSGWQIRPESVYVPIGGARCNWVAEAQQ
jgi:4-amino-4-deoxy-L-arabinose transferase-like glycosyltransferase